MAAKWAFSGVLPPQNERSSLSVHFAAGHTYAGRDKQRNESTEEDGKGERETEEGGKRGKGGKDRGKGERREG